MPVRLPSVDVPASEKRRFSEADVLAKLFQPDMRTLGYPPHDATQADGEHFLEQGWLAVNRLKSGSGSGFFDGLYLIGNAPVVLCEIKRYDAIDVAAAFDRAKQQLIDYARSEDFAEPPPFLVLYSGKPERTRFFVRKTVSEPSLLGERDYEELDEIWRWERVKEFQLRGAFSSYAPRSTISSSTCSRFARPVTRCAGSIAPWGSSRRTRITRPASRSRRSGGLRCAYAAAPHAPRSRTRRRAGARGGRAARPARSSFSASRRSGSASRSSGRTGTPIQVTPPSPLARTVPSSATRGVNPQPR
jgi:hypothetical protein